MNSNMNDHFSATYSPEDNKLRLYADERLDDELYQRVKELGFKWAPKQELFVTHWKPQREDLCIELAGEIVPEETTLIERAENKAQRLDDLSEKRTRDADAFAQAANAISQRFESGQPILVGHHSQRKAERDRDKMDAQLGKSVKATKQASYWNYRAEGVERNANRKGDQGVRIRRIKTLLADLRGWQRRINYAMKALNHWKEVAKIEDPDELLQTVTWLAGISEEEGSYSFRNAYDQLKDKTITASYVVDQSIHYQNKILTNPYYSRWISHILNRLSFENSELGVVEKFSGTLTASILQAFTRTHGAGQPKAKKIEALWQVKSSVSLPLHLANSNELMLTDDQWIDLMQSCGYKVPAAKQAAAPILNFKAVSIVARRRFYGAEPVKCQQVEMTKAEYREIYNDSRFVLPSACGQFRVKAYSQRWNDPYTVVFISDSKVHETPVSESVILDSTDQVKK